MSENRNNPGDVRRAERRVVAVRCRSDHVGTLRYGDFSNLVFTWFGRELSDADVSNYLSE